MTNPRQGYGDLYLLIDGERVGSARRETRPVKNPANGDVIGQLPIVTADDLEKALAAAETGFREWRLTTAYERAVILKKAASLLRERADEVATVMTLEQGKLKMEALWEVGWAVDVIEWQAEECRRSYGRVIPSAIRGGSSTVVREPVGPVAAFSPWNLPVLLSARKMATAIAAGCSIVLKPAHETPKTALLVAEMMLEAGVPANVLHVVNGDPRMIVDTLVKAPQIRKVSFTGSTDVGKSIAAKAAASVKRVTMELGGHAPTIIFDDADFEHVVGQSTPWKYYNAGQICIAPTRFYVHQSRHEEFVERMTDASKKLVVGDGFDERSQMGPLSNARRVEAMERLVRQAVDSGAQLTTGGGRIGNTGFFFEPTVLGGVPEDADIMSEEPFGPVVVVSPFEDDSDVIARANRLPYGLGGYVFSRSADRLKRVSHEMEVGLVGVNSYSIAFPEAPFGGVKESGYGSENSIEGMDAYLTTKFIHQA